MDVTNVFDACFTGHTEPVEEWIRTGGNPNARRGNGSTLLCVACKHNAGYLGVVEVLLKAGADANTQGKHRRTPLSNACESGDSKLVELLLKFKADPEYLDDNGATSLHIACENGLSEVVEILLRHGADPNKKLPRDCTPLHQAVYKQDHRSIIALIDAGADQCAKDFFGKMPMEYANSSTFTAVAHAMNERHKKEVSIVATACIDRIGQHSPAHHFAQDTFLLNTLFEVLMTHI
jgi:ankyrin repeat protein